MQSEVFKRGSICCQTLPHGRERTQQELPLQIGLGPALAAVRGPASPEVELAYSRALALGRQIDDHRKALPQPWSDSTPSIKLEAS